jgi:Fatty acid desaturase
VSFLGDVAPYFLPCYVFVVSHLVYYYGNGNLLWPIFLAYLVNFPYYFGSKWGLLETNLDRRSDEIFKADRRFYLPLYIFILCDCLTWIWGLCVVSGVYPNWMYNADEIFRDRICESLAGFWLFIFVWGYMAGVNCLAGHELIHRREPYNKAIGMFTFTKVLYSHFLLEHNSGHHRNVATPEDPATAKIGEDFYSFTLRSASGGFINTWRREVNRIQTKYHKKATSVQKVVENKTTWFVCLHLGLIGFIYLVFGAKAIIF